MKRLVSLLFAGTFALGVHMASAQMSGTSGGGADVGPPSLHGFTRPTPTPTPTAAPGPKKPLSASLTKDEKGKSATSAFAVADAKIYLQWNDPGANKGDKVSVSWVAEDTGGAFPKNKKITESAQTAPGPGAFGTLFLNAPAGGFPPGKYRADVYDNSKLVKSLKFTVAKK